MSPCLLGNPLLGQGVERDRDGADIKILQTASVNTGLSLREEVLFQNVKYLNYFK